MDGEDWTKFDEDQDDGETLEEILKAAGDADEDSQGKIQKNSLIYFTNNLWVIPAKPISMSYWQSPKMYSREKNRYWQKNPNFKIKLTITLDW